MDNKLVNYLNYLTSLGGNSPKIITRFLRYTVSGGSSSLIDILLFSFMVELMQIYYIIAVMISFTTSHTVNYYINRNWGFKETKTPLIKGYFYFISFGLISILLTVFFMSILVESFNFYPISARVIVLCLVGLFNFTMNYFITFRMIGR